MWRLTAITAVALAIVMATSGPSLAQWAAHGQGDGGWQQHGSHGDHDGAHRGDGDHHRGPHFAHGPLIYQSYPTYVAPIGGYWYYCPSAEAYYPYVTYCLESWVPVPAQ